MITEVKTHSGQSLKVSDEGVAGWNQLAVTITTLQIQRTRLVDWLSLRGLSELSHAVPSSTYLQ